MIKEAAIITIGSQLKTNSKEGVMERKKTLLVGIIVLLTLLFFVLTSVPGFAAGKVYRLKIQSGYPRGDLSVAMLDGFAAAAEKRSNGQLKIVTAGRS